MKRISLPYNIDLRHYQKDLFKAYFKERKKRLVQIIHRRAGKDFGTLNLCVAAMCKEPLYCLYLFPEKTQARKVIWNGLDDDGKKFIDCFPPEILKCKPKNDEMKIELKNGSIFQLSGSDRYDNLRGTNPKIIVFSEYAESNPAAWYVLSPILRRNGGAAIFCYTVRGRNHGYDLYKNNKDSKDWFVQYLPITETYDNNGKRLITEEDIAEETRAGIPKHVIDQEYYLSWDAANPGAYYADELRIAREENRMTKINVDPNLKVYTAWDLGMNDAMAIWFFQIFGKEIRFIHYYQNQDQSMDHYIDYLRSYAMEHSIDYGNHFAPHDIAVRELTTGKSRFEYCWHNGLKFNIGFRDNKLPKLSRADGIQAVRRMFKTFWFDEESCQLGLDALSSYHREFNEKTSTYNNEPYHDWASDGADAMRYACIAWQDRFDSQAETPQLRPGKFDIF